MASNRKLSWTKTDVLCPFFKDLDRSNAAVKCEGLKSAGYIVSSFGAVKNYDWHLGRFCCCRYEDCPIYKMIYAEKYQ